MRTSTSCRLSWQRPVSVTVTMEEKGVSRGDSGPRADPGHHSSCRCESPTPNLSLLPADQMPNNQIEMLWERGSLQPQHSEAWEQVQGLAGTCSAGQLCGAGLTPRGCDLSPRGGEARRALF